MKRRAFGKAVLFLLSLAVLWVGMNTLMTDSMSQHPLAVHILGQGAGWGLIVASMLGFLVVAALVKRDKTLF